jgi:hypothetical protein
MTAPAPSLGKLGAAGQEPACREDQDVGLLVSGMSHQTFTSAARIDAAFAGAVTKAGSKMGATDCWPLLLF